MGKEKETIVEEAASDMEKTAEVKIESSEKEITVKESDLQAMIDAAVVARLESINVPTVPDMAEPKSLSREEKEIKKKAAYMNEEVEVTLFYDGKAYKDDVVVNVNGKAWMIKRGVPVKVPRFVKEVLENSYAQDKVAAETRRALEEKYEKETAALS